MLQSQDHIRRLIEQMARAVAQLRTRILDGTPAELDEAGAELAELAGRAGLDLDLARRLEPESLQLMISFGGSVDPGRCWLLAELLYLDGLHAERRGRPEAAAASFARSRHLYGAVEPGWTAEIELPDADERRRELDARLAAAGRADPGPT